MGNALASDGTLFELPSPPPNGVVVPPECRVGALHVAREHPNEGIPRRSYSWHEYVESSNNLIWLEFGSRFLRKRVSLLNLKRKMYLFNFHFQQL